MVGLSEPNEFANLTFKNRYVMPPMVRNMATKGGLITEDVISHYEEVLRRCYS